MVVLCFMSSSEYSIFYLCDGLSKNGSFKRKDLTPALPKMKALCFSIETDTNNSFSS